MKEAIVELESVAPYSQSKYHQTERLEKESADDFEKRTWREKAHADADGIIFIPPMQFKESIAHAAKFAGEKIRGKGQATWSKHFVAGIIVPDGLETGVKKSEVPGEWVMCNADGKKGSGTRVPRCFPHIAKWAGKVRFIIIDDTITEEAFTRFITLAGQLIGIGRWRPCNGGMYGRFAVKSVKWMDKR